MLRPPAPSLSPYTTLFRSGVQRGHLLDSILDPRKLRWQRLQPGELRLLARGEFGGRHSGKIRGRGSGGREILLIGIATGDPRDRKSTRLNSSHLVISYAVF